MKSSRIMRNFAQVVLTIAEDIYKEDHLRFIIEEYCASMKIKAKWKLCKMD